VADSSFADADGITVHCLDHGGEGPDLLLVHATGFHARVWDPYVARLRPRFRVTAVDQRGHGLSDKPDSGYEWRGFGADVLAAVDHLGLQAPLGIGHSAGGAALVLAETTRPGTFSKLVLLDPVTPSPSWRQGAASRDNPMATAARRRRAVWDSREQMVGRMRTGTPLSSWRPEFVEAYVHHGTVDRAPEEGIALLCPPEVEAQIYEMSQHHEAWERMGRLDCPTLVVGGTGPSALWRDMSMASGRNPCIHTAVVEGGHFFPMENPDATLDVVLPFLEADA
jgi:pimeloyl-ACP methyl ester carboxylesterase